MVRDEKDADSSEHNACVYFREKEVAVVPMRMTLLVVENWLHLIRDVGGKRMYMKDKYIIV